MFSEISEARRDDVGQTRDEEMMNGTQEIQYDDGYGTAID